MPSSHIGFPDSNVPPEQLYTQLYLHAHLPPVWLIENVIKMKNIESYERYRNVFHNEDIEIVVDKYPFGIALEIENKSKLKTAEETVLFWVKRLGLKQEDAFRLSWDDKYTELCKQQNIEIFKHVKFDLPMPKVIE